LHEGTPVSRSVDPDAYAEANLILKWILGALGVFVVAVMVMSILHQREQTELHREIIRNAPPVRALNLDWDNELQRVYTSMLIRISTEQERYHKATGRYATDCEDLGLNFCGFSQQAQTADGVYSPSPHEAISPEAIVLTRIASITSAAVMGWEAAIVGGVTEGGRYRGAVACMKSSDHTPTGERFDCISDLAQLPQAVSRALCSEFKASGKVQYNAGSVRSALLDRLCIKSDSIGDVAASEADDTPATVQADELLDPESARHVRPGELEDAATSRTTDERSYPIVVEGLEIESVTQIEVRGRPGFRVIHLLDWGGSITVESYRNATLPSSYFVIDYRHPPDTAVARRWFDGYAVNAYAVMEEDSLLSLMRRLVWLTRRN
jgi:hypothetical protein